MDIKLAFFIGIIIWMFYISYNMDVECSEKGGVLVRGAVKYECVKGFEKVK